MTFWKSWPNLYRFLFALGCLFVLWVLISFLCRVVAAKIRGKLEARYQLELIERPSESTHVQRSRSVNFGVRALDSHETPAETGIVDSESLRVFSPVSRFSRISSPASTGGRKGSESTIGSVADAAAAGLNVHGQPSSAPRLKYTPQTAPRGPPPFASPGLQAMQEPSAPKPSDSATGQPASTPPSPNLVILTAPTTPLQGDSGSYFTIPNAHPYTNYMDDPPLHRRAISTSSIDEIIAGSSISKDIINGILKNRGQVQPLLQIHKNERSVTPGPPPKNNSTGLSEPDLSAPLAPVPGQPQQPLLRPRSAPPLKSHRSSYSSAYQPQNLSNILEAPFEDPDGIELKDCHRKRSTEDFQSSAIPSNNVPSPSDFVIPHPTRAPPPIPFMAQSSASTSGPPTPPVKMDTQVWDSKNKGKQKDPNQF
ncbi:hypothetical protein AOL_s00006g178 [Orbilia oligospora ATCC 24927]|uniref:Uncharacterized protein n=2 Tax=Orbilia oligospora TaxID=2813651 RepID=G1WZX7_ARTOA|nr:hypothetical protein AOL_s00006g178 [Orbilia oligospora ATCC 24927]EGX53312.1 hypothetical protein AOL_s00006g178 [Orbilia oligospora ATCC 24927]KAF3291130.1 hypothetical protein TWF970_000369 [Orbilia oligospora]